MVLISGLLQAERLDFTTLCSGYRVIPVSQDEDNCFWLSGDKNLNVLRKQERGKSNFFYSLGSMLLYLFFFLKYFPTYDSLRG